MCHDYKAPGRDTLRLGDHGRARSASSNVHVSDGVEEDAFVAMRKARDATLAAPTLLLPSIQVNIRAGRFPAAEANGVHYLKIPVKTKTASAALAVEPPQPAARAATPAQAGEIVS